MRHVLLSNDDGVFAPGLRALADAFLAKGWRVTVSAPDGERSAASHSITIKRPLVATKTTSEGVPEGTPLHVWAVDGTPADCVKAALHELSEDTPDLVVSGINNGWNVGTDVHYSGTVGAAKEAVFEGIPAIAVSASFHPNAARWRYTAELAEALARRLLENPLPPATLLNINTPRCAPEKIRGVVEAPLTRIFYTDTYDRYDRDESRIALWLKGEIIEEGCTQGADLHRLLEDYATITAIGWDLSIPKACAGLLQDME